MNEKNQDGGKTLLDRMKEIARKYGVEVTDGADRGIRGSGSWEGTAQNILVNDLQELGSTDALAVHRPSCREFLQL